jgi:hypothetical protein
MRRVITAAEISISTAARLKLRAIATCAKVLISISLFPFSAQLPKTEIAKNAI